MKRNRYTTIQRTAPQSPACTGGIRGGLMRTALAALLIATAAACSDKEDFGNGDDGNTTDLVTVRFSSVPAGEQTPGTAQSPSCQGEARGGSPETRTTIRPDGVTVWWTAATDRIGISAVPDPSVTNGTTTEENKQYAPEADGETAQFKPAGEQTGEMQLTPGTYTFYSCYPWGKYTYYAENTSVSFTLEDFVQDGGNNTAHIGKQDLMWATTTATMSDGGDPVDVKFTYFHALPMLHIRNGLTGKTITHIRVRSETDPVRGSARMSLTDGKVTPTAFTGRKISLDITNGLAEGNTASLLILPQTRDGGELIIDAMTDDGNIHELKKQLPSGGLTGGKAYRINFANDGNGYNTYGKPAGSGNSSDPYKINDKKELLWLAMAVNYFGKTGACAELTPDTKIDLNDSYWEPIGDINHPYTGTFDGNGGTVTNLKVDHFNGLAGFFGALAGHVSNLRVEGSVTAVDQANVGGIAGYTQTGSSIINCVFKGTVKGHNSIGSIAGFSWGSISGCYATGNVEATDSVAGGIAGKCSGGTIENCYSSSNVKGVFSVGGIAGTNTRDGKVTTCYATGTVSALERAGGIAGSNYGSTIENCIALNTKIIRTDGSTKETFGRVTGINDVYANKNAEIKTCAAWNGMTLPVGVTEATGNGKDGAPLTTTACKEKGTYTSTPYSFNTDVWDFDGVTFTTYLPWLKELERMWPTTPTTDHPARILVPDHLRTN